MVDNLSPYTRDILLCLERLKTRYTCKKFYEITDYENDSFEKIILSGRSKSSRDTNIANDVTCPRNDQGFIVKIGQVTSFYDVTCPRNDQGFIVKIGRGLLYVTKALGTLCL